METEMIKSEIAKTWDGEADYYDTHVSHGVQTELEKRLWMDAFRAVISPDRRLQVLDVGCGTGSMGLILSEMGHDVTGIDLSERMMDEGRKKGLSLNLSMKFQRGDAEDPPFDQNTFDIIINRHLLWTLPNPDTALENWYCILKPGGILMIIDGVWDDGNFTTKVKRNISNTLARIIEKHPHGTKGYPDRIREALPNIGGLPEEKARDYFSGAEFKAINTLNLMNIRENQQKRLPWYKKLAPGKSYYLISGKKPEDTG